VKHLIGKQIDINIDIVGDSGSGKDYLLFGPLYWKISKGIDKELVGLLPRLLNSLNNSVRQLNQVRG